MPNVPTPRRDRRTAKQRQFAKRRALLKAGAVSAGGIAAAYLKPTLTSIGVPVALALSGGPPPPPNSPAITLTPNTGPMGLTSTGTWAVSGFQPGEYVTLQVTSLCAGWALQWGESTADWTGAESNFFKLDAPYGCPFPMQFTATGRSSGRTATAPFTLTNGTPRTSPPPNNQPTLIVNPSSVQVSNALDYGFTGWGFQPGETIEVIYLNSLLASFAADGYGSFTNMASNSTNVDIGQNVFEAKGMSSGITATATVTRS